jgi:hypothetical protein
MQKPIPNHWLMGCCITHGLSRNPASSVIAFNFSKPHYFHCSAPHDHTSLAISPPGSGGGGRAFSGHGGAWSLEAPPSDCQQSDSTVHGVLSSLVLYKQALCPQLCSCQKCLSSWLQLGPGQGSSWTRCTSFYD